MIIKIIYNSQSEDKLNKLAKELSDKFTLETYNEEFLKDKKKAYKIKGSCSARMTPFISVYSDDNKLTKAFYTEASDDVFNDLKDYLCGIE